MTTFFGLRWLASTSLVAVLSLALISQAKAQDNCNNGRGNFGRGLPNGQTNFYGSPASHHFGDRWDNNRGHNVHFHGNAWDRDHDRFGRGSYNRFDYPNHDGYHDRFHSAAFRNAGYPGFASPYSAPSPYTPYNAAPYGANPYAAPPYTTQVVVPTTSPVAVPTTTYPNYPSYGRGLNVTTPNGFGLGLNF